LPPDVLAAIGRGVDLALLDELLPEADGTAVPIAVICGLAGAGKTALAIGWADAVSLWLWATDSRHTGPWSTGSTP
jgi:hypothetical protein